MISIFSRPFSFVNARVVSSQGVIANSIRIAGSRIVSLNQTAPPDEKKVDLGGSYVFPGLINAHDHLLHNNYPRSKWREKYENATEWFEDIQKHLHEDPELAGPLALSTRHKLLTSGLKNLLCGATTVCHHDPMPRRRPDAFLVRVVRSFHFSHSLQIDGEEVARSFQETPTSVPWIIHAAEGIDRQAQSEIGKLAELGCLAENTVLVHGVGASPRDLKRLVEAGGALVWCPSSNQFLFGETARVAEVSRAHRLALGTDSRLSGERDLLDEIQVAAATNQITAQDIFRAVTVDAASILKLSSAGRLLEGGPADLVVAPKRNPDPFLSLLLTRRADLELVMIGGRPMVGATSLAEVFRLRRTRASRSSLDGRPRLLSQRVLQKLRLRDIAESGFATRRKKKAE